MELRTIEDGLRVKVATTEAEWQKGLAGVDGWAADYDGMLFEMPENRRWPIYALHLEQTLYIYWLSENEGVVAISSLEKESSVYHIPVLEARYVLELFDPQDWQIGDLVRVHEPTRPANEGVGTTQ